MMDFIVPYDGIAIRPDLNTSQSISCRSENILGVI